MNFLFINYEYPPIGGGGGNATREIARALMRRGHRVAVITTRYNRQPSDDGDDGVQLVPIDSPRKHPDRCSVYEMSRFMLGALCLSPRKLSFHPDAVIGFFAIPGGPPAIRLARRFRVPCVISLRGGDVPGFGQDLQRLHALARPLLRWVWRSADYLVANGCGLAKLAEQFDAARTVRVIPNGIDCERFKAKNGPGQAGKPAPQWQREQSASMARALQTECVRLAISGRLADDKGLADGIELALLALHSIGNENWRLDVFGDGPRRESLQTQARNLGLADRIIFHGWQTKEAMPELLGQCDVLIHPSRSEGCPNAVLEAMASQLAIIATRAIGTEELIVDGENGLLVEWGDQDALARALRRVIDDAALRETLGANARRHAEQQSWDSIAQSYEELVCQ